MPCLARCRAGIRKVQFKFVILSESGELRWEDRAQPNPRQALVAIASCAGPILMSRLCESKVRRTLCAPSPGQMQDH